MKRFLFIFVFICSIAHAQIVSLNLHGDTVIYRNPLTGDSNFLISGAMAKAMITNYNNIINAASGSVNATTATNLSGSQSANLFYGSPNGSSGTGAWRAIVGADIPTLNQNTTGTAANLSGSQTANFFYAAPNGSSGSGAWRLMVAADVPTLNQNTTGSAAKLTTARTINGTSFDGSANITIAQTTAATSATTGTISVDMSVASQTGTTITPSGACTFNASGGNTGYYRAFFITTSGTSSFTLTWNTNFHPTGTLATGTTTAKHFVVLFYCTDGTNWYEVSRTVAE